MYIWTTAFEIKMLAVQLFLGMLTEAVSNIQLHIHELQQPMDHLPYHVAAELYLALVVSMADTTRTYFEILSSIAQRI